MSVIFSIVIFFVLCYLLLILPTQWLKVEYSNYDLGLNKKILQISDIHIKNLRVSLSTLKQIIEKEKPNYIFLTGDFVDYKEDEFPKLEKFLSIIKKSNIESYAVLGNHDRYIKNTKGIISLLEENNVRVLMNEYIEKDDFILIGIDDFAKGYHDVEKSFSFDKNNTKKRVVITHDPSIVDYMDETFNYFMAGHLHGKQLNIPFLFELKDMGKLANRGIYKGLHEMKNGPIYISKGISQSKYNVRFNVRAEVTIHNL